MAKSFRMGALHLAPRQLMIIEEERWRRRKRRRRVRVLLDPFTNIWSTVWSVILFPDIVDSD